MTDMDEIYKHGKKTKYLYCTIILKAIILARVFDILDKLLIDSITKHIAIWVIFCALVGLLKGISIVKLKNYRGNATIDIVITTSSFIIMGLLRVILGDQFRASALSFFVCIISLDFSYWPFKGRKRS
jgi:hypothetical protein